ncbi:MAG TPA: hypothetical protein DCY20_04495 [Firmicutes bacterium]|nr:hypothetical protein [Bacillota bacterium]
MVKLLNLNQTIYELTNQYPELINILYELGFHDIIKPNMLNTVGKIMTLQKGALMKKISLNQIQEALVMKGFTVEF